MVERWVVEKVDGGKIDGGNGGWWKLVGGKDGW